METVQKYVDQSWTYAQDHKEVTLGLAAVGALYLTGKVLSKIDTFWRYALRPSTNLKSRYGDGWAVVTGATDGIGKAYAFELARRGFKVGLVARNQEKLNSVAAELKQLYGAETKTVVFDFNWYYTEDKVNELREKLSVFDTVSILINNVGAYYNKLFDDLPEENMLSLINVNIVGLTMVTKILIPKLLANKNKGGMINIGSITTSFSISGMSVYSSTKAYVEILSKSISEEYQEKLDVMVAVCGPTKSNMSKGIKMLSSYPESVVSHTLNTLGWQTHSYGDFRHGLRAYLLNQRFLSSLVRYIDRRNIAAEVQKSV